MADYDPRRPLLQPNEVEAYDRLFRVETDFMAKAGRFDNDERESRARQKALAYIVTYYQSEKFDAFIPYLAMNYYDRYVSNHQRPVLDKNPRSNFALFVICCLTIAWKMRIKSFDVSQLLRNLKLEVDTKLLLDMELCILNRLDWRMRSLTPICFVHCFVAHVNVPNPILKLRPVHESIIRSQSQVRFTRYRPSVVAASAVLTAMSYERLDQFQQCAQSMSICPNVDWDDVAPCFRAMLDWHNEKFGGADRQTRTVLEGFDDIIKGILTRRRSDPMDVPAGTSTSGRGRVDALPALLSAARPPTVAGSCSSSVPIRDEGLMDIPLRWDAPPVLVEEDAPKSGCSRCTIA